MKNYTLDYFIDFFSAIPEEDWVSGELTKGTLHCVMGFCDVEEKDGDYVDSPKSKALAKIIRDYFNINILIKDAKILYSINDGLNLDGLPIYCLYRRPKLNIIKILRYIKNNPK